MNKKYFHNWLKNFESSRNKQKYHKFLLGGFNWKVKVFNHNWFSELKSSVIAHNLSIPIIFHLNRAQWLLAAAGEKKDKSSSIKTNFLSLEILTFNSVPFEDIFDWRQNTWFAFIQNEILLRSHFGIPFDKSLPIDLINISACLPSSKKKECQDRKNKRESKSVIHFCKYVLWRFIFIL